MPKATRWDVVNPYPFVMPPRKLGKAWCDGLVHLVQGWVTLDLFQGVTIKQGYTQSSHEETLCNVAFPPNEKAPRTPDPVTCVACIASHFSSPNDVVEP
jgi:hypothetical protein